MKSLANFFGISQGKNDNDNDLSNHQLYHQDNCDNILGDNGNSEISYIPVESIRANPFQPRKTFNQDGLRELADSIVEFGVIQPLLVRSTGDGYELIAGERRLRASQLAGLTSVPVIVKNYSNQEVAELAMIENLQREDLHFLEEAEGYQQLITEFGLTQEELAKRVGKRQSTIANKLRILKLAPNIRASLLENDLTERHARSLLKLDNLEQQQEVLAHVIDKNLNVRQTEEYIEQYLVDISQVTAAKDVKQNVVKIIKDVRIFLNTFNNVIAELKKTGVNVKYTQEQSDDFIFINLQIPKRK